MLVQIEGGWNTSRLQHPSDRCHGNLGLWLGVWHNEQWNPVTLLEAGDVEMGCGAYGTLHLMKVTSGQGCDRPDISQWSFSPAISMIFLCCWTTHYLQLWFQKIWTISIPSRQLQNKLSADLRLRSIYVYFVCFISLQCAPVCWVIFELSCHCSSSPLGSWRSFSKRSEDLLWRTTGPLANHTWWRTQSIPRHTDNCNYTPWPIIRPGNKIKR